MSKNQSLTIAMADNAKLAAAVGILADAYARIDALGVHWLQVNPSATGGRHATSGIGRAQWPPHNPSQANGPRLHPHPASKIQRPVNEGWTHRGEVERCA
jgi:hypothetical protein